MTDRLAQALAQHVCATRYEDIPPQAMAATRRLLVDTIAVGWAGSDAQGLDDLRRGLLQGSNGECDVWGTGLRAGAQDAAFLNGVAAAALEYDSLHEAGLVHADLVCVPALFALAQYRHASGREFLAALALANDVACRLAMGAAEHSGWWHSSLYGVFGAAAGCAKLLGLDAAGVRHALGIALGHAGGTQQAIVQPSGLKRAQSAIAARSGLFAAQLAACGVTAPSEPIQGRFGLYALFESGGDEGIVLGALGQRYEGALSSFKKFPVCGCGHAAIEAALQLARENHLTADMIERAAVRVSPYMATVVGQSYEPAGNPVVSAQFSVKYGVACAVMRGQLGLAEIESASAMAPELVAFASRVDVEIDESNSGKLAPAEAMFVLRDGRRLSRRVEDVPGTARNPMTSGELQAKAADCFSRGVRPLGPAAVGKLLASLDRLEDCADMADALRT